MEGNEVHSNIVPNFVAPPVASTAASQCAFVRNPWSFLARSLDVCARLSSAYTLNPAAVLNGPKRYPSPTLNRKVKLSKHQVSRPGGSEGFESVTLAASGNRTAQSTAKSRSPMPDLGDTSSRWQGAHREEQRLQCFSCRALAEEGMKSITVVDNSTRRERNHSCAPSPRRQSPGAAPALMAAATGRLRKNRPLGKTRRIRRWRPLNSGATERAKNSAVSSEAETRTVGAYFGGSARSKEKNIKYREARDRNTYADRECTGGVKIRRPRIHWVGLGRRWRPAGPTRASARAPTAWRRDDSDPGSA